MRWSNFLGEISSAQKKTIHVTILGKRYNCRSKLREDVFTMHSRNWAIGKIKMISSEILKVVSSSKTSLELISSTNWLSSSFKSFKNPLNQFLVLPFQPPPPYDNNYKQLSLRNCLILFTFSYESYMLWFNMRLDKIQHNKIKLIKLMKQKQTLLAKLMNKKETHSYEPNVIMYTLGIINGFVLIIKCRV